MAEPLEGRVRTLETTVGDLDARVELNEDGALRAQVLAGRADRDVGGMKAEMAVFRKQNNQLHKATREDLRELRGHVDDRFAEIRGLLDGQAAFNQQLAGMLNVLIGREGDARPEQ